MKKELEEAIKLIETERQNDIKKHHELTNSFRTKINLLISKTPTSELRNELTELNIIFETIHFSNEDLLTKL